MRYLIYLLIIFSASLNAGEILKWTDENGNVFYGDTPPQEVTTERVRVVGAPSNPGRALPRLSETSSGTGTTASGGDQRASNRQAGNIPDDQAKIACEYAREDLKVINSSTRIRIKEADGGQRYMSTEEINERKQLAESDIAQYCR